MKNDNKPGNGKWWLPAIVIFVGLSGWIIIPVILALFLGRWLDHKYGTSPWLLFISIGVAFVISMIGLAVSAKREYKKLDNGLKKDKTNEHKNDPK